MISVLELKKSARVALPGGLWPSLWVLAIAAVLLGGVYGLGYVALSKQSSGSSFLPSLRVPWFMESVTYYHMEYALNSDEYNDVIFLGASGTLAGMKTRDFEERTGLRAYNFGSVLDLGPDGHLEIFRAYLENHPEPEMLVYVAFPRDVGDESASDQELRGRFFRVYGTANSPEVSRKSYTFREYYQEGFWGIYGFVKGGFRHPYDAPRGPRPSHRELGPLLAEERGWQQYPQARTLNLRYLEELSAFTVSEWYDDSFREMAELAQEHGIQFMLYMLPVPAHNSRVDDSPLISWSREFKAAYPEVKIEGLPIETYDRSLWGNAFHLNLDGAEIFTGHVSRAVRETLGRAGDD